MRIDKIRKKNSNTNIIDINLEKLSIKYNNENSLYDSKTWIFKGEKGNSNINLNKLVNKKDFNHYLPILKDIRFFVSNELNYFSHSTVETTIKRIKVFFNFLRDYDLHINSFSEINYDLLLHYSDYLKKQKGATAKWSTFLRFLSNLEKYPVISVSDHIKYKNFPTAKFSKSETDKINPYTKEEFDAVSKTIVSILKDYFSSNEINDITFVKSAYWFIALCTGLNQTALNNLCFQDIELLKEDEKSKTYILTGIKNRAKNRVQQQTITIKNIENHFFEKVIAELKRLSNLFNVGDDYLFNQRKLHNSNLITRYNGLNTGFTDSKTYLLYADKYNANNISLSTQKIRNHWSVNLLEYTNSEVVVSKMLGHSNIETTKNHYMKRMFSNEMEAQFNLFQELIYLFSKDENSDDWVLFQERLGIKELSIEELIKKIKEGNFDTSVGKCIKSTDKQCQSYFKCFNCQHYSIVGDKDLWKVMSFREALIEEKSQSENFEDEYKPIIETINMILKDFDKDNLIKARTLLRKSRHPFWKNNIMIKTITNNFEKENK